MKTAEIKICSVHEGGRIVVLIIGVIIGALAEIGIYQIAVDDAEMIERGRKHEKEKI